MNTDRTIILTMLANKVINADEAERLLILTEALHRVERRPYPTESDIPLMSQLVGHFEDEDEPDHDFLADHSDRANFYTLGGIAGIADFFELPDLPPFPEVVDWDGFEAFPNSIPFDRDGFMHSFRNLHERLEHMKTQFSDFQDRFATWKGETGFDNEIL